MDPSRSPFLRRTAFVEENSISILRERKFGSKSKLSHLITRPIDQV